MALTGAFNFTGITMLAAVWLAPAGLAKDKTPAGPARDEIRVAAHLPLPGGEVLRLFTTQHYDRRYLYAELDGGHGVALVDVTNVAKPTLISDTAYPSSRFDRIAVVAGTAAVVTSEEVDPPAPPPTTVRIMDFTDPREAKVAREFTGVTAMMRDDSRGLIFLANKDGIWILQQHLAADPRSEEEYARYVQLSH